MMSTTLAPGGAGPRSAAGLGAALLLGAIAVCTAMALRTPMTGAIDDDMARVAAALAGGAGAVQTPAQTRADLQRLVERDPKNGRAWVLLAFLDLDAERYADAAAAFEQALAHSRKVARDPAVWCEYADALGMAQGTLAGRPTEAIVKALELRPGHAKALEMAGSAAYERRDFAAAAQHWRSLREQLQADTRPYRELSAAIERAERLAATSLPPPR